MYINGEYVNVVLLNGVCDRGCVHENSDGSYTIFINPNLSEQEQYEAYQHEMYHINNRDFEKNCVNAIEINAHKGA